MKRRALLLGIQDYDELRLRIPAVHNDLKSLAAALKLAGFPDAEISIPVGKEFTTNRLIGAISKFLSAANEGDELLLYFSGHGIEFEGFRLLVPADYPSLHPLAVTQMVSDLQIYALARTSRATSVVVVLDACREGVKLRLGPSGPGQKSVPGQEVDEPETDSASIAFIHSCKLGSKSYFDADDDGRSHFTSALCDVLAREHGPSRLQDILAEINGILRRYGRGQEACLGETCVGRGGDPNLLLLKEDPLGRLQQKIEDSAWCRALRNLRLFNGIETRALRFQVEAIVQRCEEAVGESAGLFREQRWRRPQAPFEVLRRFEGLLDQNEADDASSGRRGMPAVGFNDAEAALLLTAPYIYEAVIAVAELLLVKEGQPISSKTTMQGGDHSYMWTAWRTAFTGESHWSQRRELARREDPKFEEDAATWQLQRFFHRSGELWQFGDEESSTRGAWAGRAMVNIVALAPFEGTFSDRRIGLLMSGERLMRLARFMFCTGDEIEAAYQPEYTSSPSPAEFHVGEGTGQWTVNERRIAHLLSLASRLALDARRIPDVLADHLGVDPKICAERIRAELEQAEWHEHKQHLTLAVKCFHQALDLALSIEVEALNRHLQWLQAQGFAWAAALPRGVNARDLRPLVQQGQEAYRRPHILFHLEPGKIRELLMGAKLYGDPQLALREVYQNALDACRYRRARHAYLKATRQHSSLSIYQPKILFRIGRDENDRPYIECEDNGIGMDPTHIQGLFANAGRRFADSHEFHLERARWDEFRISFAINSRFGIGVFSYFMLASEVTIWTRRLSPFGSPASVGVHASILAGSELFRWRNDQEACPLAGTRVRLYLDGHRGSKRQLLESILDWLWLPEVDTILEDEGREFFILRAGELAPRPFSASQPKTYGYSYGYEYENGDEDEDEDQPRIVFDFGGSDSTGHPWAFCVLPRNGRRARPSDAPSLMDGVETVMPVSVHVLADGISTTKLVRASHTPVLVLNLKGDLAPVLSVDRNRLLSWDAGRRATERAILEDLFTQAISVPEITLVHLAELAFYFPAAAHATNKKLKERGPAKELFPGGGSRVPVGDVGVNEVDRYICERLLLRVPKTPLPHVSSQLLTGNLEELVRGRLCVLGSAGLNLPSPLAALVTRDKNNASLLENGERWRSRLFLVDAHAVPCDPESHYPARQIDLDLAEKVTPLSLLAASKIWSVSNIQLSELLAPLPSHCLPSGLTPDKITKVNSVALAVVTSVFGPIENWTSRRSLRADSELKKIPLGAIIVAAANHELTMGDLSISLRPLQALGFTVPEIPRSAGSLTPLPLSAKMMTRSLTGEEPFREEVTAVQIIRFAALHQMSIADAIRFAKSLSVFGVTVADLPPREEDSFVPDRMLYKLLRPSEHGELPCAPLDLLHDFDHHLPSYTITVGEIADLCNSIGLTAPDLTTEEYAMRLGPSSFNIVAFIAGRDDSFQLRPFDVAVLCAQWNSPVRGVIEAAEPLARLGLSIPSYDPPSLDYRLSVRTASLLTGDFLGDNSVPSESSTQPGTLNRLCLFVAAAFWEITLTEVLEIARPLVALGVQIPTFSPGLEAYQPSLEQAKLLSESPDMDGWWLHELSPSHILRVALSESASIGRILDLAKPLAEIVDTGQLGVLEPFRTYIPDHLAELHLLSASNKVSPLGVAIASWAEKRPVFEYTHTLDLLEAVGSDVSEARSFVDSVK